MALFCSSPSISSICSPQFCRPFAIRSFSVSKSLNRFTSYPNFPRNSVFNPPVITKSSFQNPHLSTSSLKPENNASSTAIIFIKGLPKSTSEERVKTAFSKFGDLNRVKILPDKKTKQPLSFAYVCFVNEESVLSAVHEMDGKVYTCHHCKAAIMQKPS